MRHARVLSLLELQQGTRQGENPCRKPPAEPSDETAQDSKQGRSIEALPASEVVCRLWVIQGSGEDALEIGACRNVKNTGKPCALIAHARFNEGGQVCGTMVCLLRHRQTKGAETAMLNLMSYASVLYSTRFSGSAPSPQSSEGATQTQPHPPRTALHSRPASAARSSAP